MHNYNCTNSIDIKLLQRTTIYDTLIFYKKIHIITNIFKNLTFKKLKNSLTYNYNSYIKFLHNQYKQL